MMNRKGKVNGLIYDVVTIEEYQNNRELYDNKFTAIEKDGILYPIVKNKNTPGYFNGGGLFGQYIQPAPDQIDNYSANNIIDFNSATSMKEVMNKSASLRNMEKEILCSSDNKFKPVIDEKDDIEMKALKEAVIAKDIDLDKYGYRFGANYVNDKRLFKNNSLSLGKLKTISNALDIKLTLTLEDKNENVPNPIGRVIKVVITGGMDND